MSDLLAASTRNKHQRTGHRCFRQRPSSVLALLTGLIFLGLGWHLAEPLPSQHWLTSETTLGGSFQLGAAPSGESESDAGTVFDPAAERPPWVRREERSSSLRQPLSSPRDVFVNVTAAELQALLSSESLSSQRITLLKLLHRLPRLRLEDVRRFAERTRDTTWPDVLDDPARHQLQLFSLQGNVQRVELQQVDPALAEYLNLDRFYRAELDLADGPSVTVLARQVPEAWGRDVPINEPTRGWGILVQTRPGADRDAAKPRSLVLVSRRLGWFPQTQRPSAGVDPDQLLLVQLGYDISLLEDIRQRNGKNLSSPTDQACFYPLLAAVGRAGPADLAARQRPLDLSDILLHPRQQHGKLFALEGSARRITRISVARPYLRELLGSDHYYQIDLFVPLGNRRVRLTSAAADDDEVPEFTDHLPVTVCVRRLPPALEPSEKTSKVIRLPAFFFKLWSYRSQYVRDFGAAQRQLSPMFVGMEPTVVTSRRTANPFAALALAAIGILALAGIVAGLWLSRKGDEQFARQTLNRRFELPPGSSLEIDVADVDGTDDALPKGSD